MASHDMWRTYTEKMVRKWTSPLSKSDPIPAQPRKRNAWMATWFGLIPSAMAHTWRTWRNK